MQTIHNAKQDQFRHFFFNRIVSVWNSLSNDLVSASSLSLFKLRLHKFDLHTVAALVFLCLFNFSSLVSVIECEFSHHCVVFK